MKTMKNFAAQQLTKKQMNEVKGGVANVTVQCYVDGQWVGYYTGASVAQIEQYIHSLYGSGYCN